MRENSRNKIFIFGTSGRQSLGRHHKRPVKILVLLFIFTTTFTGYSQLSGEDLISETMDQLQILESRVFSQQVRSHSFGSESLIVIPVISEEEEGIIILDAYLALVENKSGVILSRYYGKNMWYSDAVTLTHLEIDPVIYNLNGLDPGYGIKLHYSGQSRPNPYNATELSLYVKKDEQLKPVLQDYRIAYLNGETDTRCTGEFETHSKSLEITDGSTNNFYDLKFTDSIQRSLSTEENCEPTVVEILQEVELLQFHDGSYKKS